MASLEPRLTALKLGPTEKRDAAGKLLPAASKKRPLKGAAP